MGKGACEPHLLVPLGAQFFILYSPRRTKSNHNESYVYRAIIIVENWRGGPAAGETGANFAWPPFALLFLHGWHLPAAAVHLTHSLACEPQTYNVLLSAQRKQTDQNEIYPFHFFSSCWSTTVKAFAHQSIALMWFLTAETHKKYRNTQVDSITY